MDLPPTMLKATLYTNNFIGNINIARSITAHNIVSGNVNANNINISAGVGGNLTANNFIGNITSVLANIGNLATGQINVAGNVVLSSGKSVFASQMPFFWTSSIHGNPATGANLIYTGSMMDDATYIDAQSGVRLTRAVNALNGSIKWNATDFDFTKDFNLRAFIYMSSGADGIWMGVGASDPGNGINYASDNGGRATRFWTYVYQYTELFGNNGQRIGQLQNNNANLQNLWISADLTIRTINNRKYMHVFANNQLQNASDITGWIPGGNYIYVGGGTGGENAEHRVNHVELKYI